ncbi:MAG: class I tRNA ligase family protein, partial [Candidatus Diapherotrites archaeon]
MPNNFKEIEQKWIKKWENEKTFEANPNEKPKFFVTFPYPYMNSLMHIGHFYTLMRVEAMARYKRMRGYNVLFPQGWHCTGSPIESAAQRIKENEPKQIEIMKQLGLKEEQIKEFQEPKKWVEYFPKEAEKDLKSLGLSIDWRRSFITTSLNPHYDKFIKWQFTKLKEKNYVIKGSHPVVWCTKDNAPVPDHSRIEGEGETPQEFTLLKFKFEDKYIIAATLRPETVFGQTNLWVNPEIEYIIAEVDKEKWIGSQEFFAKLKQQNHEVTTIGKLKGKELIGKKVIAPEIHKTIIVLPATFCDPTKGTGIVTSVPSDAPDDYIGLLYLQNSKETCEKYGLNYEEICKIKPIPIINSAELGEMAAEKMVKEMNIKSPEERQKLEEAKKIVYKKGYYEGIMGKNTRKYSGMPVIKAKELVKEELIQNKEATIFYELTGKVVCRCLQEATVKIVTDQWFI